MGYTYDQILNRMTDKFEELSGYRPDRISDASVKLKLLAGEVYALGSEIEWLKRQMFPNTATGEQLDLHAAQRGLSRIRGNKASGYLVFRLDMPSDHDTLIPQGTVCSNADGSLRYVTVQDETIARNNIYKLVECEAENSGEQYNVASDEIKVIITYFSVGMEINNASSFIGGTNDESDEQLRRRITESYRNTPNGANKEYYIRLAESVDGIQSATVTGSMSGGGLTICLGGRGDVPDNEAYLNARWLLNTGRPFGVDLSVTRPELVSVNVTLSVDTKDGYVANEVIANVRNGITAFFLSLGVGENVRLAALGKAILECDGVDNYTFSNMSDVSITDSQLAKMGTVTVTSPDD